MKNDLSNSSNNFKLPKVILMFFAFVFLISLFLNTFEPRKPATIPLNDYSYTIKYVDYKVNKLIKKQDLPSVVIALIDEEDVIYKKAYGISDIKNATPATLDTVYKLGSITKLFTGIEVMRMYEEGLISLDTPINEYMPEFKIIENSKSSTPITVRSLLTHRSGLPRGSTLMNWYWEARPNVLETLVSSIADEYQAYPVNYRYKYSNIGYNILGRLIEVVRGIEPPSEEAVSGWPYYMSEVILKPLGMNNTQFGSNKLLYGVDSKLDIAKGYYNDDGENKPYDQYDIINLASGNMQSTMNDMIKFTQFVLNIESTEGNGIISPETLWSMYDEQYSKLRDPQTNGLTWFSDKKLLGELLVFHSGTNQGIISLIMLMPKRKLGLIVFSNSDAFEDVQIQLAIDTLKIMLETKYGILQEEKILAEEIMVNSSTLEKYVGKYILNGDIVEIIQDSDLKVIYQNRKIKMIPITPSKFRLSHLYADVDNIELEFFVDDPDNEDIMILTLGDYFICPRYPNIKEIPVLWKTLVGKYDIYPRVPSIYSDEEIIGTLDIHIEDGVLMTTESKILVTDDDNHITILGGVFSGERMIYDVTSGNITWQHLIFKPQGHHE